MARLSRHSRPQRGHLDLDGSGHRLRSGRAVARPGLTASSVRLRSSSLDIAGRQPRGLPAHPTWASESWGPHRRIVGAALRRSRRRGARSLGEGRFPPVVLAWSAERRRSPPDAPGGAFALRGSSNEYPLPLSFPTSRRTRLSSPVTPCRLPGRDVWRTPPPGGVAPSGCGIATGGKDASSRGQNFVTPCVSRRSTAGPRTAERVT